MTATTTTARNAALDALRVLSLVGIVTLHVAGGGFHDSKPLAFVLDELSRFAVPVFFLLSAYFWKADELARPLALVGRVARRVLPAFALWTAVFVLLRQLEHPSRPLDLSPGALLNLAWSGGPAFHLWFLPALVLATGLVATSGKALGWRITLLLALGLYLGGTLVGAYARPLFGHGFPFWMDRNGVFMGPVFLVAGVLLRRHRDAVARLPFTAIVVGLVLFALLQLAEGYFVVGRYPMGHDYSLATLGYAVAVALLFMRIELKSPLWTTLGAATFGAYLLHLLVLRVLVMDIGLGDHSLAVIALCVAISLALSLGYGHARGLLVPSTGKPSAAG